MLPAANTRPSRLTSSGSPGRFSTSTTRPPLLNTPLATTTLPTTSRVPDTYDATNGPLEGLASGRRGRRPSRHSKRDPDDQQGANRSLSSGVPCFIFLRARRVPPRDG